MKGFLLIISLTLLSSITFGQVVYEDINNSAIYEFLDELANLKIITLNSAVKPYSRKFIAEKLRQAQKACNLSNLPTYQNTNLPTYQLTNLPAYQLTTRQKKELLFYLQDFQLERNGADTVAVGERQDQLAEGYKYKLELLSRKQQSMALALNPLGLHYRDRLFTFSLRPILGLQYMVNENGSAFHRWWGGSIFGYIGSNFGFYANLRDNNESVPLAKPEYFTEAQGGVYKYRDDGGVDYSEMRGGIVGSVNWGSLGIMLDRVAWGENYHGANIFSGKAPAFPYIQLHLNPVKWFDFNYIHGWLNSNVIDSGRSYYTNGEYREVFRNKFMAANMFTFIPWKGLNLSIGNSIIYSDSDLNPLYFIPFLFFNAADAIKNNYSNNAGSNSQLFFNISSRQIRRLHLYISFFIDEWKSSRLLKPDYNNFTSLKAGFSFSDLFHRNISVTAEYTRTQPMTYLHYIPSTTFASNDYSLGNYLRENSQEIYLMVSWRPLRGLLLSASWTNAMHGDDVPYNYNAGYMVDMIPFIKNKTWQNNSFEFSSRYEFVNNGYFFLQFTNGNRKGDVGFQPEFMHGQTNTLSTGINVGF